MFLVLDDVSILVNGILVLGSYKRNKDALLAWIVLSVIVLLGNVNNFDSHMIISRVVNLNINL